MHVFDVIMIVFIILVSVYLVHHVLSIPPYEVIMMTFAVMILVATWLCRRMEQPSTEPFTQAQSQEPTEVVSRLSAEEDLTQIASQCKIYTTSFSSTSYNTGKQWTNVSFTSDNHNECQDGGSRRYMTFENAPIFSRGSGFALGSNRLMGPMCNMLGIDILQPFTIFMSFKNGTFVPEENDVELLKLYGNSKNNNAISLYVAANSINVQNNVQQGDLQLMWVDEEEHVQCRMDPDDTAFVFQDTDLSSIFIVRTLDKLRVVYVYGPDSGATVIGEKDISDVTATFSNKELVINQGKNWKANIFAFGVMNSALSESDAITFHLHFYDEYMKANNTTFQNIINSYNTLSDYVEGIRRCPLDDATCSRCRAITDWTNPHHIISASPECRQSINAYCSVNSDADLCTCWNVNSPDYNTIACINFRGVFTNTSCLDNLSENDVKYIKQKYKMVYEEDCPKPKDKECDCSKPGELITNKYSDIDYDKMRIDPKGLRDSSPSQLKIDNVYLEEQTASGSLESSRVMNKSDPDTYQKSKLLIPTSAPTTDKKMTLTNLYKSDPSMNFDQNLNEGAKAFAKTSEMTNNSSPLINRLMGFFKSS